MSLENNVRNKEKKLENSKLFKSVFGKIPNSLIFLSNTKSPSTPISI